MKLIKAEPTVRQLELLVWAAVFVTIFFTLLPEEGLLLALSFAVINTFFYALIIYGNISVLYPRLYMPGRLAAYIVSAGVMLMAIGASRCYVILFVHNAISHDQPEEVTFQRLLNFVTAGVLIFVLSFVFRIARAYFTIKKQSEQMLLQKSEAELSLLKSQVQPHFLFNTLNNINYVLHREAPQSAILIERLADIMRYFVDESPKNKVSIATEVSFLENYIELERIRIRYKTEVSFTKRYHEGGLMPPMLLMTFVENIFKHGINKSGANSIKISLIQQDGYLHFETTNAINRQDKVGKDADRAGKGHFAPGKDGGFGLYNLEKRLALLYNAEFYLNTRESEGLFIAELKIPLS